MASPIDPSTTTYLSQMETFQRQITTSAFKLAGGIDLSSNMTTTKMSKQNTIAPVFISKITKAFLDVLYAFLDGLVHLGSEESPTVTGRRTIIADAATITGTNPLELLDLTDAVSGLKIYDVYHCSLCAQEHPSLAGHIQLQPSHVAVDTKYGNPTRECVLGIDRR